jgi:hypothetical protein
MKILVFMMVLVLIYFLLYMKGRRDLRRDKKRFLGKMKEKYGVPGDKEYKVERFERVSGYYEKHRQPGQIDDITWNDLNMDDVFCRMDTSLSAAGEEYLYYLLRTPSFSQKELEDREEIIEFFATEEDTRQKAQWILHGLGHTGKFSLYDYLDYLGELTIPSKAFALVIDLLYIPLILLTAWKLMPWLFILILLVVFQTVRYFSEKERMSPYYISLSYIVRLLYSCDKLEKTLPNLAGDLTSEMRHGVRELRSLGSRFGLLMMGGALGGSGVSSGNPLDLLLDYIRMLTHIDLMLFYHMLKYLRRHIGAADVLLTCAGRIEAGIVLASYRASLEDGYCIPVFTEGEDGLFIREGYHPLVVDPVKNTITAKRGVLLTGSNASGKSTFLKMAALEVLFAQTIHTCLARSFEAPMVHLLTSMSLRDNVRQGDSYFMAEIKSLQRILKTAEKSQLPVYCMIDEVLRGTNTVERIAASEQILRSMAGGNMICFAATHDIELTTLLEKVYDNYHFEEVIRDGDILFPYQLQKGAAMTRNAILLLEILGYPGEMVEKAGRRAEEFMQTGRWL